MSDNVRALVKNCRDNNVTRDSVADFFVGRDIFITGATGFVGKVLIEKLLRSCLNIGNIYILVRTKGTLDIEKRVQEMIAEPIFDSIKRNSPYQLRKLLPVMGDVTEPGLGMSAEDRKMLQNTVSVVFHSAATVRFDETLKSAITINVCGTKSIIALCEGMKCLEAFVHVSTAYCNCERVDVEEKVYEPECDIEQMINLCETLGTDELDRLTPTLLGEMPNTYTLTKRMSEWIVCKSELPFVIIRPSIIIASSAEPFAGWVDNWNGPNCLLGAMYKGLLRSLTCDKNGTSDLIPVDFVANMMICSAWGVVNQNKYGSVYHCTSGCRNKTTWGEMAKISLGFARMYPLSDSVWYPGGNFCNNFLAHKFSQMFLHFLPALIVDWQAKLRGKGPILMPVQNKIKKRAYFLEFFLQRTWEFHDDNSSKLFESLSFDDRRKFNFDVSKIDWSRQMENYFLGIRTFLFKENRASLPAARRRLLLQFMMHSLLKLATCVVVTWSCWNRFTSLRGLFYSMADVFLRIGRMVPYVKIPK